MPIFASVVRGVGHGCVGSELAFLCETSLVAVRCDCAEVVGICVCGRYVGRWADCVDGPDDWDTHAQVDSKAAVDSQPAPAANTGEAVRSRQRHSEQAAHQRDHGGAEPTRRYFGDERVQLVPEPQGPSEKETANGMERAVRVVVMLAMVCV